MIDIGLTHIALAVTDAEKSIDFYSRYAGMSVVHERTASDGERRVVWLSDKTRPFVIVLLEAESPEPVLRPFAHLGVGCKSREEVDRLCELARKEGILAKEPEDSGYPVGYWAFISDPDGHSLEVAYGQEVGLTVENS
ncbi:MAG: VOC family protein [Pyrinomonadaceae bacterium]|nr:VOC family protein [Pyrinomonadaceae bacterium]